MASSCSTLALETTAARGMWTRVAPASRSVRDCSPGIHCPYYCDAVHHSEAILLYTLQAISQHFEGSKLAKDLAKLLASET